MPRKTAWEGKVLQVPISESCHAEKSGKDDEKVHLCDPDPVRVSWPRAQAQSSVWGASCPNWLSRGCLLSWCCPQHKIADHTCLHLMPKMSVNVNQTVWTRYAHFKMPFLGCRVRSTLRLTPPPHSSDSGTSGSPRRVVSRLSRMVTS